jgi:hypothetical protein
MAQLIAIGWQTEETPEDQQADEAGVLNKVRDFLFQ